MASKKKASKILVVDADVLVYKVTAACQEKFHWEQDEITNYIDMARAKQSADGMLNEWRKLHHCTDIYLGISDHKRNWRKLVLPSYKSQRTKEKPMGYYELEAYLTATYGTFQFDTLEGDDVIAMYATGLKPGACVMVTIDKDLKGVPAAQWNPDTGDSLTPTKAQADYFHLYQTLMGDKTDNYDGCPGIGPVKAEAILLPFVSKKGFDTKGAWEAVKATYKKADRFEADALVQARVARILRSDEYDYDNNSPILWSPK